MKTSTLIVLFLILICVVDNDTYTAQDDSLQAGTVVVDASGTEMVYVPDGVFDFGMQEDRIHNTFSQFMDASALDDYVEGMQIIGVTPPTRTEVSSFWIDRYEVTVAQYQPFMERCVRSGLCREIANTIPETEGNENFPQVSVSWPDAQRYCIFRGARLPTEIEWEYAASGPDNLIFPWGNEASIIFPPMLYEVGTIETNVSWTGIYDMGGNAYEWVDDLFMLRISSRPSWDFGEATRTIRGGSFASGYNANTFSRDEAGMDATSQVIGFRCARSTNPTE